MTAIAAQLLANELLADIGRMLGLVAVAGVLSTGIGLVHRWYADTKAPDGLAVLVGLSAVALYLNTAGALGEVVGGQAELLALEAAVFNILTFAIGVIVSVTGGRLGDRIGLSLFVPDSTSPEVGRIARSVGRTTTIELPDDVEKIEDIDGYEPVRAETKEKLLDQRLVFPKRLTDDDLRARFVERLRTDYGVGHVDVDFDDDRSIEYLAVGSRESGLGPTLPPGSAAVAVRADPANSASPGDIVQVWQPKAQADGSKSATESTVDSSGTDADGRSTGPRRITNAEVRGTAGDVVTLVLDAEEAKGLDTGRRYRLVTMPVEPRTDREFAGQLRAAEETMRAVVIGEGSSLASATVGSVDIAVAAVRGVDGTVDAIPSRDRQLTAGETLYAIGRPDRLRRLEVAATGTQQTAAQPTKEE
ncbi:MAG: potassium transporter TrkA [Natronomonas sp.]